MKCVWLYLIPVVLAAQDHPTTASALAWNGFTAEFVARVEPPGNSVQRLPGGVAPRQDRVHRFITDRASGRYFGYDLLLEPLADSNTVRLRIEPLTMPQDFRGTFVA